MVSTQEPNSVTDLCGNETSQPKQPVLRGLDSPKISCSLLLDKKINENNQVKRFRFPSQIDLRQIQYM